jgi:hypothetical protein
MLSHWFLPISFFDPKHGGSMFLQNIDGISAGYTALYPRR